jgi:hypothetical protein
MSFRWVFFGHIVNGVHCQDRHILSGHVMPCHAMPCLAPGKTPYSSATAQHTGSTGAPTKRVPTVRQHRHLGHAMAAPVATMHCMASPRGAAVGSAKTVRGRCARGSRCARGRPRGRPSARPPGTLSTPVGPAGRAYQRARTHGFAGADWLRAASHAAPWAGLGAGAPRTGWLHITRCLGR